MTKKRTARVLEIVKEYVNSLIKTGTGQPLPVGYTPIEQIRGALFHWIAVPFGGRDVFCKLRCPNATQIEQCGDMTNIVPKEEDGKPKYDYGEIIKIRNYQEELCRLVFVIPTFETIASAVGEEDFAMSDKRRELAEIKKRFAENSGAMSETEKAALETRIRTVELQLGFILPDDTMAFACNWAMGNDVSDIKRLSRESLLRAASLAKAHGKAPTDYLSGVYTDFNKNEIDAYALGILDEHLKDRQAVGGRFRWLGGRSVNGRS
jgi:hypothetical protein